jgi:S-adenosylmethionine synthetase
MSLEAAAGKNPVNHIGKIYNVLARELSAQVAKEYPQINECNIAVLSQIGHKIDDPLNLNINLIVEKGANFENIKSKSNYIAENWLENIGKFSLDLSLGKYKTF